MLSRDPPASARQDGGSVATRTAPTARVPETAKQADLRDRLEQENATAIAEKYALLLDGLDPSMRPRILAMLAARDNVDPLSSTSIADYERELSLALSGEKYALYEQLRESESEQASIRSFAQRLERTSPLSLEQKHSLLLARLRSGNAIASLELQADMIDGESANMEDIYALDIATAGLAYHRQQFLNQARAFLSDEQWAALVEHEYEPGR